MDYAEMMQYEFEQAEYAEFIDDDSLIPADWDVDSKMLYDLAREEDSAEIMAWNYR